MTDEDWIKIDRDDPKWEERLKDLRAIDKEWGFWRSDGELLQDIEWEVNQARKHGTEEGTTDS